VGTNNEVVTDGGDGFLPRNAGEWEERIVRLVEDPDLRAQIGDRARKRVLSAYSLAAVLPQYLHLLRDLAAPEKL
jgi:glycosyltransferase involved in cell wall biosynthesis